LCDAIFLLSSLFWIILYGSGAVTLLLTPLLDHLAPSERTLPRLSIVIAARDEEESIRSAVMSLLSQSYPDYELIVVDDRSGDSTGAILDRLSAEYPDRMKIIHVAQLPDGWLGKVNALYRATAIAEGEWILYTDADVHFGDGALRKALSFAVERGIDHLAVGPRMIAGSLSLELLFRSFVSQFILFASPVMQGIFSRNIAIGVGAFNLVRRAALDRTEGFSWLRMETADDVALGLMLKRSGAKWAFLLSTKDVSVRWYTSVAQMVRGLEKNIYGAAAHYNPIRLLIIVGMSVITSLAPIIALVMDSPIVTAVSIPALTSLLTYAAVVWKRFGGSPLPSLLLPLGQLGIALILLRAGILCHLRGGIVWRNTLYGIRELRAGRRVGV
jgi:cellulose synthase/poly-beta-1,6-N-acetylglucosamine synthase-like glycosyltransferase